jgi:beta-galactosidase
MPAKPNLQGVIRDNNEAIMVFEPVKKAIGYTVQYRRKNSKEWKAFEVNAAELRHIRITGLNGEDIYEFRIASKNANGKSGFTEAVQQLNSTK